MQMFRGLLSAVWFVAALACGAAARAADDNAFIRVDTDADDRPRALQLGVVTYAGEDVSVDLIGAIHIGDRAYYQQLNDAFEAYDVVLYEMVAPAGVDVVAEVDSRKGLVSNTQVSMARFLDLTFQLEEIDYGLPNLVHADLSPREFRQSMDERGESLYVYFWRIFFATIEEYARDPLGLRDYKILTSTVRSGSDVSLKTMLAYRLTDFDSIQDVFGEDASSTIVGARNARAIEVLRRELDAGARRIGIFFGVAHMPDLESRLLDEVGLAYAKTDWVDAWRLDESRDAD